MDHLKPLQGVCSTESNDAEPDEADEAVEDDTRLPFTDNAITQSRPINTTTTITYSPEAPISSADHNQLVWYGCPITH